MSQIALPPSIAPAVVPDASLAVKWYLDDEADVVAARAVYEQWQRGDIFLLAPDCFYYELGAVIRTAERRTPPRLTTEQGDEIFRVLAEVPIYTFPSRLLLPDAARRSRASGTSLYDALYLTLAELSDATFITADERLFERVRALQYVRLLGQDASGTQPA